MIGLHVSCRVNSYVFMVDAAHSQSAASDTRESSRLSLGTFRIQHYSFRKKAISTHRNLTKAVKNLLLSSFMLVVYRGQTEVGEIKSSCWFVSFHHKILSKTFVSCYLMITKDNRLIIYTPEVSIWSGTQRREKWKNSY